MAAAAGVPLFLESGGDVGFLLEEGGRLGSKEDRGRLTEAMGV